MAREGSELAAGGIPAGCSARHTHLAVWQVKRRSLAHRVELFDVVARRVRVALVEHQPVRVTEEGSGFGVVEDSAGDVAPLVVGHEDVTVGANADAVRLTATRVERHVFAIGGDLKQPAAPRDVAVAAPRRFKRFTFGKETQPQGTVEAAFLVANQTEGVFVVVAGVTPALAKPFEALRDPVLVGISDPGQLGPLQHVDLTIVFAGHKAERFVQAGGKLFPFGLLGLERPDLTTAGAHHQTSVGHPVHTTNFQQDTIRCRDISDLVVRIGGAHGADSRGDGKESKNMNSHGYLVLK